jgi:hypothetical protein
MVAPMRHDLKPHATSPCETVSRISVEAVRLATGELSLHYALEGNTEALLVPGRDASLRTDNLWQHTCFEVFIASGTASAYREFNLSPSTRWAAYSFTDFREGMANLEQPVEPAITFTQSPTTIDLRARVSPILPKHEPWRLAVTAVIEEKSGHKSFWSLTHTQPRPEFHHPTGFTLILPPP